MIKVISNLIKSSSSPYTQKSPRAMARNQAKIDDTFKRLVKLGDEFVNQTKIDDTFKLLMKTGDEFVNQVNIDDTFKRVVEIAESK